MKRVEKKRGRPRNVCKRANQNAGAVQFLMQPHMGAPVMMMAGPGWSGSWFEKATPPPRISQLAHRARDGAHIFSSTGRAAAFHS